MSEAYRYVEPNNPILRKISDPIPNDQITSEETQLLIDNMFQLAFPEQGDKRKPVLVGLAAPQVGVAKRVILVDTQSDGSGGSGDLQAFINPVIVEQSDEKVEGYEGCYSTDRVCGIVERAKAIKVMAYGRDGNRIESVFSGFPAVIFQHEVDHLDGHVFVDRIKRDEDLHWVEKIEFPEYRKNWRNWPHKISRADWELIQQS